MKEGYTHEQAIAAFWSKVEVKGPDECWPWKRCRTTTGYGQLHWQGRRHKAHRIAFFLSGGCLSEDLFVCHACDNPLCCNPKHLFVGTHDDNMADATRKNRMHPGERHAMAKLTSSQVLEIRLEHKAGIPSSWLARKYSISDQNVCDIVKGRTWGWLKEP